jgi:predicted nucleic acid-binding protein
VSFLLDTNVISEWIKPKPDLNVISWVAEVDEDRVFISVISFAELRHGVELLPAGRRRDRLAHWLAEELPERFEDRILAIDHHVAENWGVIIARGRRAGMTLGSMDAFVVATAQTRGLTLVTRKVKDFEPIGISLLDPWAARPSS